jgi:hypothetical protein
MPIPVTCSCGRALRLKDEYAGKRVRCPSCQSPLSVPTPERDAEEEALAVLLEDSPDKGEQRRGIQSAPPARREWREEVTDEPPRPRVVKVERESRRERRVDRDEPRGALPQGWFENVNAGMVGGLLMMLIAVGWFVGGLAVGLIFFYPPILFVLGLIAFFKGLVGRAP